MWMDFLPRKLACCRPVVPPQGDGPRPPDPPLMPGRLSSNLDFFGGSYVRTNMLNNPQIEPDISRPLTPLGKVIM